MRIAITGGSGFIGTHLLKRLSSEGHDVWVFDESSGAVFQKTSVEFVFGNINDFDDVDRFIARSKPDRVIHLAAQSQAHESINIPRYTIETNVMGTLNLLDSLRYHEFSKSIIVASSDKAYGKLNSNSYTEDHDLNGIYPYDASKSMLEILCRSYANTYNMPIATIRSSNVYGSHDHNTLRLIPGIINSYKNNTKFYIRNSGKDKRDYLHINDLVDAYIKVSEYVESGGKERAFNVSAQDVHTTLQVFGYMQNMLPEQVWHEVVHEKSSELEYQSVNSDKIRGLTGWNPQFKLKTSLPEIIDSYLSF